MLDATQLQLREDVVLVEAHLRKLMTAQADIPHRLHDAMCHALFGGGKRLRPVLLIWTWRAITGNDDAHEAVLDAAAAIEMIHTYSLVHDDLPAMDDDDLRRGNPTCHVAFDEATAILAGDALLTLAFEVLGVGQRDGMVAELARCAGPAGMVGGQMLDLLAEGKDLGASMIREIHGRKTACLISCALTMGALAAGAPEDVVSRLRIAGRDLGLAFQAADDLLDVTGTSQQLGKTPGKDDRAGKATWVALEGFEKAQARTAELGGAGSANLAACLIAGAHGDRLLDLIGYLWTRDH